MMWVLYTPLLFDGKPFCYVQKKPISHSCIGEALVGWIDMIWGARRIGGNISCRATRDVLFRLGLQ